MAITAQEVKNILGNQTIDDLIVETVITDATTYVNAALTDCDGLTDAEKESIAKWLAAHMLASGPVRQAKRERLGEAEIEYDTQKGDGFNSTSYGRMALALDRCGKLSASAKQAIKIHAITSFNE